MTGIYVAHTPAQAEQANTLVELLESSLSLDEEGIRCSTLPGYAGTAGDADTLRADIGGSQAVIALMDEYALHDPQMMLEVGVAFTYDKRMLLLVEGAAHGDALPGILRGMTLVERVDEGALVSMVEDLAFELGLRPRLGGSAREAIHMLSSAPPPPPDNMPTVRPGAMVAGGDAAPDAQFAQSKPTEPELPRPAAVPRTEPSEPEPEPARAKPRTPTPALRAPEPLPKPTPQPHITLPEPAAILQGAVPSPRPTPASLPAPPAALSAPPPASTTVQMGTLPSSVFDDFEEAPFDDEDPMREVGVLELSDDDVVLEEVATPAFDLAAEVDAAVDAIAESVLSCTDSLEAGRAISECSFHRDEGGDFGAELQATFGRFVDAVGGSWNALRPLDDIEVWLGATDNLLEGLTPEQQYLADWYEIGYQFSTLRSIAEAGLPDDPAERAPYEEIWQQSMEQFWLSAQRAQIAGEEVGRLRGMLENLIGPEPQRDYTFMATSLDALRGYATTADRQRRWAS